MNRDTDELPSIMAELDHSAKSIDAHQYVFPSVPLCSY